MYNNLNIIKEKLAVDLNRFGDQVKADVFLLIDKLTDKDTFVDNHLFMNLQNILSLPQQEAKYFIDLAIELASASAFAPVLLLEKIPTLSFYGVAADVGRLLSNIKNYGARAVALFLGSDQLKTDDLIDVLEHSNISFYKKLLNSVNARHHEFGIACSFIMRYSAKIETAITAELIDAYLDVCSELVKKYDARIIEQYIRNISDFIAFVPLNEHLSFIESWAKKSFFAAEFILTYPKIAFSKDIQSGSIRFEENDKNIKSIKIDILKTENYLAALANPFLFEDPDFSALLLVWPLANKPLKSNVLFQLQQDNYKNYILTNSDIVNDRNSIDKVTNENWLKPWTFCGEVVDLLFIRKRIGSLLQERNKFSAEAKTIVKTHSAIFDRSNSEYTDTRVLSMLHAVLSYCVDDAAKNELTHMVDFILGNRDPLKHFLSQSTLVIQAWERNPWIDYGRSDELYSCTGIGDYNAANAPGFLADLNINNLDIWSGGIRVGRIHLCLAKDSLNQPIMLLDCVDGTERIIASKKKFELIMSAVFEYTRWLGISHIKVNHDIDFNMTPKKFIAYIEKTFPDKDKIDFFSRFLAVSTSRHLLPYPCQTFLESFIKSNGAFIRGTVITL